MIFDDILQLTDEQLEEEFIIRTNKVATHLWGGRKVNGFGKDISPQWEEFFSKQKANAFLETTIMLIPENWSPTIYSNGYTNGVYVGPKVILHHSLSSGGDPKVEGTGKTTQHALLRACCRAYIMEENWKENDLKTQLMTLKDRITPAPWYFSEIPDADGDFVTLGTHEGEHYEECFAQFFSGNFSEDEMKANADMVTTIMNNLDKIIDAL